MGNTIEIGRIAVPTGFYEKNGETKKNYTNIGRLMKTVRDDGTEGEWIKLDAAALSPSLLIMCRPLMEKGSDKVVASVFSDDKRTEAPPVSTEDEL